MLIMNVIYQHLTKDKEKLKNLKTFEGPRQLRWRRKRTEEGRINFQNKCVSSQKIRMRKEEGATVAATPTFPQQAASLFRRAVGQ
jgi:hypothetical protein